MYPESYGPGATVYDNSDEGSWACESCGDQYGRTEVPIDRDGHQYCMIGCWLYEAGCWLLENAPLCLVADHAVHVYAQYACACPAGATS